MTPERPESNDELQLRRQRREARRKRRQRAAMLRLALALGMIVLAAVMIIVFSTGKSAAPATEPSTQPSASTEPSTQPSLQATEPSTRPTEPEQTVIHIAAGGDVNVTDEIVTAAMNVTGYDFSQVFLDVAPVLSDADLTIVNFEGTLAGPPYGTQTGSAPAALAETLARCGVDIVQTANSASIRAGVLGLQSTLSGIRAAGMIPVGTFADEEAFRESGGYTLVEIQGIRIAIVAFTKGMDNLGLPSGSENCVNLLYEDYTTDYKTIDRDGIKSILRKIKTDQPDLTIALVHWGSEYNENISRSQENIQTYLMDNGVDVVLGTHSHLLHAIDHDPAAGTLVAWSLGDLFGNAVEPGSNYSAILDIEITKDNVMDTTSVTGYSVTPIYTLTDDQSTLGGHRVVRLESALARYEQDYFGRITSSAKEAMEYALKRVDQRINANTETEE